MALKSTWVTTDAFQASDENAVANAVNAFGTAPSGAVVGTTDTQALTNKDLTDVTNTLPYDLSIIGFGSVTTRAIGTGDNPMGVHLARACTLASVTYRVATADASGNLVVELRNNGAQIAGTSATIAAANQVAGGTVSGSWACAAGDIITVYVTGVGTTPGAGLVADITGTS